ncbi:glycoside hydrolase family 9 protein [Cohnella sp. GCM10027633]|uniref:glycoside hydrolase family 9 protein n=1 Tax=unclassified Cohnella TaxID=2636738 RepID=UPI00363BA2D5
MPRRTKLSLPALLLAMTLTAGCFGNEAAEPSVKPSATPTAAASATPIPIAEARVEGLRIHVDQVGYMPNAPKTAVFASDEPFEPLAVQVVDNDGKTAWEGLSPAASMDANSGDWVARIDFGSLTADGRYEVAAGGNLSDPFYVGAGVFDDAWAKVAKSYTFQRANFEQDDSVTGLKLLAGHKQDKEARLYYEDEGNPSVLDVSGGWYDAGDYGKYVPTAAITVGQLMIAYELYPEAASGKFLDDREKAFWPEGAKAPDLLAEIKYELDWLLRMQRDDGAAYHKVSGMTFPPYILPAEDLQDRYVFGQSTFGTAMLAGAAAMGARVYEPFDPAYASELLDRAKRAQAWLDGHPEPYFRVDEGQNSGSGPYDKTSDREERFWALSELFKTTGDEAYDAIVQREYADLAGKPPGIVGWGNAQLLGQWAIATASRTPSAGRDEAAAAIVQAADGIVGRIDGDGYRFSLTADEYAWGSNKNALAYGELLLLANRLKPDVAYENGALDQLHYALGRNAMGMSYVTGVGSRYPAKAHHRISMMSGTKVPGLLVGGPNKYGDDDALKKVIAQGVSPAKSYVDDVSSYSSNEYAIDYNAPLFVALTAFRSAN